jgi:antitoxin ParD1/3/4
LNTTLNVSITDSLKRFVERRVAEGGYGSASELIRELLREALRRHMQEQVEAKLLAALELPAAPMTPARWARLREAVQRRAREKRKRR